MKRFNATVPAGMHVPQPPPNVIPMPPSPHPALPPDVGDPEPPGGLDPISDPPVPPHPDTPQPPARLVLHRLPQVLRSHRGPAALTTRSHP